MRSVPCSRPLACATAVGALLAWAGGAAGTELYRWVDEQGIVHFADVPVPGAEKITVSDAQTYRAPARSTSAAARASANSVAAAAYTRVAVSSPTAEQVYSGGGVTLSVDLEPALAPGHQIWFLLDGKRVETAAPTSTDAQVEDVPRGAHSVVAQVLDETGVVLLTSAPVTFYVREHSSIEAPRGPALSKPHP